MEDKSAPIIIIDSDDEEDTYHAAHLEIEREPPESHPNYYKVKLRVGRRRHTYLIPRAVTPDHFLVDTRFSPLNFIPLAPGMGMVLPFGPLSAFGSHVPPIFGTFPPFGAFAPSPPPPSPSPPAMPSPPVSPSPDSFYSPLTPFYTFPPHVQHSHFAPPAPPSPHSPTFSRMLSRPRRTLTPRICQSSTMNESAFFFSNEPSERDQNTPHLLCDHARRCDLPISNTTPSARFLNAASTHVDMYDGRNYPRFGNMDAPQSISSMNYDYGFATTHADHLPQSRNPTPSETFLNTESTSHVDVNTPSPIKHDGRRNYPRFGNMNAPSTSSMRYDYRIATTPDHLPQNHNPIPSERFLNEELTRHVDVNTPFITHDGRNYPSFENMNAPSTSSMRYGNGYATTREDYLPQSRNPIPSERFLNAESTRHVDVYTPTPKAHDGRNYPRFENMDAPSASAMRYNYGFATTRADHLAQSRSNRVFGIDAPFQSKQMAPFTQTSCRFAECTGVSKSHAPSTSRNYSQNKNLPSNQIEVIDLVDNTQEIGNVDKSSSQSTADNGDEDENVVDEINNIAEDTERDEDGNETTDPVNLNVTFTRAEQMRLGVAEGNLYCRSKDMIIACRTIIYKRN